MDRKMPVYISLFLMMALAMPVREVWAISWNNDLKAALKEAKENRKPVMVDFSTKWCKWCKELDRNTYSDNRVNELSAYFICVKVDAEEYPAIADKYNIRGYPTVAFLNHNGLVNSRVMGYRTPEAFIKIMDSVLGKMGISRKDTNIARDQGLQLSGIIYNKQKMPVAIINNTLVKEGDYIGNGRVSKITKDKVEILFADKSVMLAID
jgi:thioredoxin-related protein